MCLLLSAAPSHTGRASLKKVYEDYLQLLPQYQEIDSLEDVTCIRPFFGFVPNWIDSPLQPITSRLLHIGDSAGNRSQLSFAGQCSLSSAPKKHVCVMWPISHCSQRPCCLAMQCWSQKLTLDVCVQYQALHCIASNQVKCRLFAAGHHACRLWCHGTTPAKADRGPHVCP